MTTKDIEEIVEEFYFRYVYQPLEGSERLDGKASEAVDWLRTTLTTLTQHHQAEVERRVEEERERIEQSIENVIMNPIRGADGVANYEYNMGYLDALQALNPTKTDKQTEV